MKYRLASVLELIRKFCFATMIPSLLLASCATAPEIFKASSALLVPWSEEAQGRFPELPYAARYHKGSKTLVYIASMHEHRANNTLFDLIEREYSALKPQVVVVEGLGSFLGFSPRKYVKLFPKSLTAEFWEGGESMYSACIAHRNGVPFIGAEPSPRYVKDRVSSSEYRMHDMLYYYLVRQIGQWKRTGEGRPFGELFSEFITILAKIYGLDPDQLNDVEKFKSWYLEKNKKAFVYSKVTSEETAPLLSKGALYTQRLSHFDDIIRNTNIVETISKMLNRFDRVLVVYGAGHHVQQNRVLEEMMGRPSLLDEGTSGKL